jgi:type I restriction enzyme, S subunit
MSESAAVPPQPSIWDRATLGEVCHSGGGSIQTGPFGSQLHADDYKEEGVPIITVEHLREGKITHENLPLVGSVDRQRLSRYSLSVGDLVFSRVGAIDRCALVFEEEDGWLFSGRCLRVRFGKEKVDPRFLSYSLNSWPQRQWILNHSVGSTMACLNTAILSAVPLDLPSIAEQRRIAAILALLDTAIEHTEALIAKYRRIRAGLMHDLFTRGVTPDGRLRTSRFEAPKMYKESLLGWIPSEWDVRSWGRETVSWAMGPRFAAEQYTENGNLATLRTTDMDTSGNINYSTMPRARLELAGIQQHLLQPGDLVVSRSGSCGIAAVFEGFELPVLPGAFLIRFRFRARALPQFLRFYVNSEIGAARMARIAEGGVQKNIRGTEINRLPIPVPPGREQAAIVEMIQCADAAILHEARFREKMRLEKQGLMHDLLTGPSCMSVERS